MAEGNGVDRHAGVDRIVDTIRDASREIATPPDERRMIYAKGENLRHVRHGLLRPQFRRGELLLLLVGRRQVVAVVLRAEHDLRLRRAEALQVALSKGRLRQRARFLWPPEMETPPVRRREEGSAKAIDLICKEESARAARLLRAAQFGMNRQDLTTQIARVFGFSKTGARIEENVAEMLEAQIEAGRITTDPGGLLQAANDEQDKP